MLALPPIEVDVSAAVVDNLERSVEAVMVPPTAPPFNVYCAYVNCMGDEDSAVVPSAML